jgi:uncharacterized protein YndB with AHSA1/START domain
MNASNEVSELRIVRVLDAPRGLVFANWSGAEHIGAWFAPDGYEVTLSEADSRVGGRWRVRYVSPEGEAHVESGEFIELEAPSRIALSLTQADERGHTGPRTVVTVELEDLGERTRMTFVQTGFDSAARRDGNAIGWAECFRKLDEALRDQVGERELRQLFADWSDASARKDLDACMRPVAEDAVSYEHEMPLEVRGLNAIRAVCRRGFESATGKVRWDVPELEVIVRGDVAVTWGMNRMRLTPPNGESQVLWSRGTRAFRKIDGAWKLVHQHVSFPFDPASGAVRTDLAPSASGK